jgi:hypothetical protein
MNHLILAETQFFAMINGKDNGSTETAYGGFVQEVINLCYGGNDAKHIIVALAFAEIELQHHPQNLSVSEENVVTVYIRKALSFIRKMHGIRFCNYLRATTNIHIRNQSHSPSLAMDR